MEERKFDYERFKREAVEGLRSGKGFSGKDNVLLPLLEGALDGEFTDFLTNKEEPNRRNGRTTKTVRTESGCFELEPPGTVTATLNRSWYRNDRQ